MSTSEPARGHLFVVHGDLGHLVCDAFAVSAGSDQKSPSSTWEELVHGRVVSSRARSVGDGRAVYPIDQEGPTPYVVPIAGSQRRPIEWYTHAIATYLELALAEWRPPKSAGPDRLPRFALPFLGSGGGGGYLRKGGLLDKTLATLQAFVAKHAVDVVLVLDKQASYDAAQALRRQLPSAWDALDGGLARRADELAARALRGELALFVGAGVSKGAGLPDWDELIKKIAVDHGMSSKVDKLSAWEQAELLERAFARKPGSAQSLADAVVALLKPHHRHALAHALLASVPVHELVTTNYDALLEQAVADTGRSLHVIPYGGRPERDRPWLMKLHGCLDHPEDIVLSRTSFLRYEAGRAALAGLLAGVLVTRHVLFVGSGFADDNVIRIVDEVLRLWDTGLDRGRAASGREASHRARLGTNLAVGPSPRSALWDDVVEWVALDAESHERGARTLDLILDRVAAQASTGAAYLFTEAFDHILPAEDKAARRALQQFFTATDDTDNAALRAAAAELRARFGERAQAFAGAERLGRGRSS